MSSNSYHFNSESIQIISSGRIVCLTGIGHGGSSNKAAIADVTAAAVLKNVVIVGSLYANKRHWYRAGRILTRADRKWVSRLITHREEPEHFRQTLERKPDDIKVVIQFSEI